MRKLLVALIIFGAIAPKICCAQEEDARLNLKKWGLAYCLSEHLKGPSAEKDTGGALEAYFQRGAHGNEKAYVNVRNFFGSAMKNSTNFKKSDNSRLAIVGCLDIYESKDYQRLIKEQDRYLSL